MERDVWVTYKIRIDLPVDAEPNDIMDHPEITAPPTAEIVDWGFESAVSQRW